MNTDQYERLIDDPYRFYGIEGPREKNRVSRLFAASIEIVKNAITRKSLTSSNARERNGRSSESF